MRDNLTEFAELPNTIVRRIRPERPIAEPSDETTELIGKIAQTITGPPAVVPLFHRQVTVVEASTFGSPAVRLVRDHK